MIFALFLLLGLQAVQAVPAEPAPAQAAERDVYTACFIEQLSRLERRDIANWAGEFSIRNASTALRRCQSAKAELTASIERDLAANPAFADPRLRALELENRVMMTELPLLLLVRARGR